jgi:hypothetical protein
MDCSVIGYILSHMTRQIQSFANGAGILLDCRIAPPLGARIGYDSRLFETVELQADGLGATAFDTVDEPHDVAIRKSSGCL